MLHVVTMNSGGNGGEYRPFPDPDPDHDPDPGGRPMAPPTVVDRPFRRHNVSSVADTPSLLRAA